MSRARASGALKTVVLMGPGKGIEKSILWHKQRQLLCFGWHVCLERRIPFIDNAFVYSKYLVTCQ